MTPFHSLLQLCTVISKYMVDSCNVKKASVFDSNKHNLDECANLIGIRITPPSTFIQNIRNVQKIQKIGIYKSDYLAIFGLNTFVAFCSMCIISIKTCFII